MGIRNLLLQWSPTACGLALTLGGGVLSRTSELLAPTGKPRHGVSLWVLVPRVSLTLVGHGAQEWNPVPCIPLLGLGWPLGPSGHCCDGAPCTSSHQISESLVGQVPMMTFSLEAVVTSSPLS